MDEFFQKENIFLVVGATNDEEKYGSKVFKHLRAEEKNVIAINQHGGEIQGTPAYASVTAFLQRIEELFNEQKRKETISKIVLVMVIPPASALDIIQEAMGHGVDKIWFQPGSESDEALVFCRENELKEVHGQCIMATNIL